MALSALAQAILGFVAIVCVGAVLRAAGIVKREDARPLNAVIIYVGLPAFVFGAVHGAELTVDAFRLIALSWLVFAVLFGLALLLARLLRLRPERAGGFVLAASLGNTGFIGYPLTAALLGAGAVPLAVFYDVFGTVLQLVLVGFPTTRRFVGGERFSKRGLLRELATFPALIAAVV
ncbi:MAG TPA: AEC family transporter, partial [Coriobacteriia bacterium]|nr:AEC family transporter [Coriobacteriia bacterium]